MAADEGPVAFVSTRPHPRLVPSPGGEETSGEAGFNSVGMPTRNPVSRIFPDNFPEAHTPRLALLHAVQGPPGGFDRLEMADQLLGACKAPGIIVCACMESCNTDAEVFNRAIRECACDNANAVPLKGVLIGTLEVSLWLLQADDGGEVGYVVKLKHRRVLAYPGRPLREWDLKNLIGGLSWAMSQLLSRCAYRKWYRQKL